MTVTRALLFAAFCLVGLAQIPMGTARAEVAAAATVPAPIGLDGDGTVYALLSNAGWTLATGQAAKEVKVVRRATPGSLDRYLRQDDAYIWATTCTAQAQQVAFRRTFFLPGPPKTFGAIFRTTNSSGPIGSFRLKINGKLVLSVAGSAMTYGAYTIPETASILARTIQYGANRVEVEVSKVAQTPANNKCVEGSTPLGFRFEIYGKFEADLFLTNTPNVIEDCYKKAASPAKTMTLNVTSRFASIRNLGPSGAYRPHISVKVTATGAKEMYFLNVGAMGMTCAVIWQSKTAGFLECDIAPWSEGLTPGLEFRVGSELAVNSSGLPIFSKPLIQVKASLSSKTADPKYNHVDQFRAHVCQPWSTDPNCNDATACNKTTITN